MCEYSRIILQRSISAAYRTNERHVSKAMAKLDDMIATLTDLNPITEEELTIGAHAVIEEFANDSPAV